MMDNNDRYWGEWVYLKMQQEHLVEHLLSQPWCISEDSTEREAWINWSNKSIFLCMGILLCWVWVVRCAVFYNEIWHFQWNVSGYKTFNFQKIRLFQDGALSFHHKRLQKHHKCMYESGLYDLCASLLIFWSSSEVA